MTKLNMETPSQPRKKKICQVAAWTRGCEHTIDDSGTAGDALGGPGEVAEGQTQSTELAVATASGGNIMVASCKK